MCLLCYLSTDKEVEKIPFNDNSPAFNIEKTDKRPSGCTKQFVYYCGSSTGCGCAFADAHFELSDELLMQTEKELNAGELSDATAMKWWDCNVPPPDNQEELSQLLQSIPDGRKDVNDLLALLQDIHRSGYDSELAFFWEGNGENIEIGAIFDIDLAVKRPHIDFEIEFGAIKYSGFYGYQSDFLLYRFKALTDCCP